MNIYFCGSIRGGREDAGLYHRMIEFLKGYGKVLTEHVGDPALTEMGNDGTSEDIWKRDTDWLKESDIVLAECSRPSHGVGYEVAYAEALGKETHIFYGGADGRLSAMLEGCPNYGIHYYKSEDELFSELKEVMEEFRENAVKI